MRVHTSAYDAAKRYAAPVALILLCQLATLSYLQAALSISSSRHFWLDEVLAVWAARLPSFAAVTAAIWKGAEFSPPTYDLFLHYLFEFFGSGPLVARLPSILAVLLSAITMAIVVWRRLGPFSAAITFGVILNSCLFEFAIQARPYALVIALLSVAVLIWSTCKPGDGTRWRAASIAFLLFACVSLHFYAILAFAIFALMEGLWSIAHRRFRPAIWLALAGAPVASLVWLPLMLHLAAYNSGDTAGQSFYGAPTLDHFADDVVALFLGLKAFALFVIAAIILIAAANVAAYIRQKAPCRSPAVINPNEADIAIIGFSLLAVLPLGFALALLATHVFSPRYALPSTIGAVLLFVLALRRVPYDRVISLALLAVLFVLPLLSSPPKDVSALALDLVRRAPSGPIVVSDGLVFVELMESADLTMRSRFVHLRRPLGVSDGDGTVERQIERLHASFRPDLPIEDFSSFTEEHPSFTVLGRPGTSTDALSSWLIAKGWVAGVQGLRQDLALLDVKAPSGAQPSR